MVENRQVFGSNERERWNIKAVDRSIDLSTSLIITSYLLYDCLKHFNCKICKINRKINKLLLDRVLDKIIKS